MYSFETRHDFLEHIGQLLRSMPFNDWEGALRTTLDMRGLVFYLVSIEQVTVHVVSVAKELT